MRYKANASTYAVYYTPSGPSGYIHISFNTDREVIDGKLSCMPANINKNWDAAYVINMSRLYLTYGRL